MRRVLLLLGVLGVLYALLIGDDGGAGVSSRRPAQTPSPSERVELTALGDPDGVASYLEHLGATIEVRSQRRIQALIPTARLPELRAARSMLRIEPPARFVALDVDSATELINADRWHAAGFTGHGVRVAVVDAGFDGYQELLGVTLPQRVQAVSFRTDGALENGTDHGTRAAQVVHLVAPGAELYLLNFETLTELSAAVDFILERDIDVVSFSLGFIHSGPGDGSGPVNEIVTRGADGGATWVVAAGNWARQHWAGEFADSDEDSIHEFAPGESQNGRTFRAGDLVIVSLRWDDEWGAACSDYDLELFGPDGSLVRASRQAQDCAGDPVEGLQVLATEAGRYEVRIVKASADEPRDLDLMVVGSPGRRESLDRFVEEGSLSEPADHPSVVTVGAVSGVEPLAVDLFSSRGPTIDGREKPEVVAPTGLVGALEGGAAFAGTSAAAPHVAGVAALLREAFPRAATEEIRAQLASRALALPSEGLVDGDTRGNGGGLAYLGSLSGLGALLPVGAEEARIRGVLPPSAGLAILVYSGPDGYPLRFAHLLTEGREPLAWFRFDVAGQRWDRYIVGAPAAVNSFASVQNGGVLMARFAAPPDVTSELVGTGDEATSGRRAAVPGSER